MGFPYVQLLTKGIVIEVCGEWMGAGRGGDGREFLIGAAWVDV